MSTETKGRILDVAERLFADFGFSATSLRDITSEANVNLAAVNYHFGSKEALLSALMERRFRPVNERRLALLDDLEASAGSSGLKLEDILKAFLVPPFHKQAEWGEGGEKFLKLVGRIHSETNEEIRAAFLGLFKEVLVRFTAALQRALPHLNADEVSRRMLFIVGAMAFTMTFGQSLIPRGTRTASDPEQLLGSLIKFAAAGVAGSAPTFAAVRVASRGEPQ